MEISISLCQVPQLKLRNEEFKRQEFWSKVMAVGDEEWLKSQASLIKTKRFKIVKCEEIHYAIGR